MNLFDDGKSVGGLTCSKSMRSGNYIHEFTAVLIEWCKSFYIYPSLLSPFHEGIINKFDLFTLFKRRAKFVENEGFYRACEIRKSTFFCIKNHSCERFCD